MPGWQVLSSAVSILGYCGKPGWRRSTYILHLERLGSIAPLLRRPGRPFLDPLEVRAAGPAEHGGRPRGEADESRHRGVVRLAVAGGGLGGGRGGPRQGSETAR